MLCYGSPLLCNIIEIIISLLSFSTQSTRTGFSFCGMPFLPNDVYFIERLTSGTLGYFSLDEFESRSIQGPFGLRIERDTHDILEGDFRGPHASRWNW